MGVYDGQIASAQSLIARKGEACTWHVGKVAVANVNEPWKQAASAVAEVTHPVSILFLPMDRSFAQLIRYMRGTEAVIGSEYGLMGAVSFVPAITGVVERSDGTKRGITSIDPLAPNGEAILYVIEFTK